jgi:hypothetical protein
MTYPLHRGERRALRRQHADRILERANAEAAISGASIKCRIGNHAPGGCQNDGTGCLCACHDPASQES